MKLRLKRYLNSPLGIWHRIKRDLPFLLRGTSYYAEAARKQPKTPLIPQNDDRSIERYVNYRAQRKAKGVVYTCVTNDYDDLTQTADSHYINMDWDYICFTDSIEDCSVGQIGIWEIRPLVVSHWDSTRNNRWHKMHPHLLFPEYTESIYIDANVAILSPSIFKEIANKRASLVIPKHPLRNCIYEEYANVFAEFMDDPNLIKNELKLIRRSGMPHDIGLTENNIIYRRHNELPIIALMSEWWFMISNFSRRDQLSLCWLLWQHDIKIHDITIPHSSMEAGRYLILPHKKRIRH